MITLKEYEIYLKVKAFIETEGCGESSNSATNKCSCLCSINHKIR